MLYGDTLSESMNWHHLLPEFEEELDQIEKSHRYLVRVSCEEFDREYERQLGAHDPENYDGGEAIYDAEKELGINPWDVASHAGLMALTRAISLSEVTLARMAAAWFSEPNEVVFPNGKLWSRAWEGSFYWTCLVVPFKTDGNGFGALRDLRDLYVHGYGIPAFEERRTILARKLHADFDVSPITEEEATLGYQDGTYFFGEWTRFSPATGQLESDLFTHRHADLSPLATYRALRRIRGHIFAAFDALRNGVRDDLSAETSKFVRDYEKWLAR